ncbi:hypothetical protein OH77DRAFT_1428811 [Trametes cingulata]|nr:hypothetical protein OH77DRAFT_1428811 [Trametes cingulata]
MLAQDIIGVLLFAAALGTTRADHSYPSGPRSPRPTQPLSASDAFTDSAPVPSTIPISPCVNKCVSQAAKETGCSSLSDTSCVCAKVNSLVAHATFCALGCPLEDAGQAHILISETCGGTGGASSLGGGPPQPTPTTVNTDPSSGSGPVNSSGGAAVSSPPASAPAGQSAGTDPSGNATPGTPGISSSTTAAAGERGGEGGSPPEASSADGQSSGASGTRPIVTVVTTLTDAAAAATDLNPPANGAARPRMLDMHGARGVLVAGLMVFASAVGMLL